MDQFIEKALEWIAVYGLKVIAALAILIFGRITAKIIRKVLTKILTRGKIDPTLVSFTSSVAYVFLMAFVFIAAVGQLGVQTASFVAVIGAAGLAVGLALQGSLSNFAAGVLMIIFKPFKIGDYVEAGGTAGTVSEIGIFTTELNTPDNKKVIIPNSKATGGVITNYSVNDKRRIDIVASVSYKDNLDTVRKVLEEIVSREERILEEPAPTIGVLELAESSIDFAVRPWVATADYWKVRFSLLEEIKRRFDENGISIPFPQSDVHLIKE